MLAYVLGFLTCYLATAALLLWGVWRDDPPLDWRAGALEALQMLAWPWAFFGGCREGK